MYFKDDLLYLTVTEVGHKRKGPTITFYKGNREVPEQTGLKDVQLSFLPESAWRQDIKNTASAISSSSGKTLVLDYRSLFSD